MPTRLISSVLALVFLSAFLPAQDPPGRPPLPDDPQERRKIVLERFDADGDGHLNSAERKKALAWLRKYRPVRPLGGPPDGLPPGGEFGRTGPPGGPPPGGPGRGSRRGPRTRPLTQEFDANGNGWLEDSERTKARAAAKSGGGGRSRGSRRRGSGRGPGRGRGQGEDTRPSIEPHQVDKASVAPMAGEDLYDSGTLRTLFLDFPNEDWIAEISDFYRTDVEVPATLTVDGKVYDKVGVRFRGNSSFFGISWSKKKSFNISLDLVDEDQRLYGYKTLNLLNGHADPSFLREVMYLRACREYIPAPQSNLAKLVVNGESWGVYVNTQQFNKDFLKEAFGTRDGVRWKIPAGSRGVGSLRWVDDEAQFKSSFELKTKQGSEGALARLMALARTLHETPDQDVEKALRGLVDIDGALWFLALDTVLMDGDGYVSRGSDYFLYEDSMGRFHFIPHDSNESFQGGGGGPGSQRYPRGVDLAPLLFADDPERPLIRRLLSVPHLRARYLAHVRTVRDRWLDWDGVIGPLFLSYHQMIDGEARRDDKALYGYGAFQSSVEGEAPPESRSSGRRSRRRPSLKEFVETRRAYLDEDKSLSGPWPVVDDVTVKAQDGSLRVRVKTSGAAKTSRVVFWHAAKKNIPFDAVTLHDDGRHGDGAAGDGVFGGTVQGLSEGKILYYAEARAEAAGTAAFWPRTAEAGPKRIRVR